MSQATGYILRLSEQRLSRLRDELSYSGRFAEAVPGFAHPRKSALLTFVTEDSSSAAYLAKSRRGVAAGTDLSRLNLDDIHELSPPLDLRDIASRVSPRFRTPLLSKFTQGGLLTPKQFHALVDATLAARPDLQSLLTRYSSSFRDRIEALPPKAKAQLASEKEAIATALNIAGFDRKELLDWEPGGTAPIPNFLTGLPQARLREDQVVANDLVNLPGFTHLQQDVTGRAIFEGETGRMAVILANRLPLEELTGTDLIYYNVPFHAFVMVQYKMMESQDSAPPIFRLPSEQLQIEIQRMETLLKSIASVKSDEDPSGYRLNANPFFIKFCPRMVFQPEDSGLAKGMYIPLEHFSLLAQSEALTQERGGRGITFRNVGRHLDNTGFAALISGGWVGTTRAQSTIIQRAVMNTLEAGRAAVLAVHTNDVPLLEDSDDGETLPVELGAEDRELPF